MSQLIHPKNYKALLDMHKTEQGIKLIKDFFSKTWQPNCVCAVSPPPCL